MDKNTQSNQTRDRGKRGSKDSPENQRPNKSFLVDKKPRIVNSDEAYPFQIGNQYILKGYRKDYETYSDFFRSLFQVHNQVMNIWTHLIGALICAFIFARMIYQDGALSSNHVPSPLARSELTSLIGQHTQWVNLDSDIHRLQIWAEKIEIQTEAFSLQESGNKSVLGVYQALKDSRKLLKILKTSKKLFFYLDQASQGHSTTAFDDLSVPSRHKFLTKFDEFYQSLQKAKNLKIEILEQSDQKAQNLLPELKHFQEFLNKVKDMKKVENLHQGGKLIFVACAICCLASSTAFHLFLDHSKKTSKIFLRIDFSFIILLIWGTCSMCFYYAYMCFPWYQWFYITFFSVVSFIDFVLCMSEKWSREEYNGIRTFGFVLLVILAIGSYVHMRFILVNPETGIKDTYPLALMFNRNIPYILITYGSGVLFYITKIPERFKPGFFDNWWASHILWHYCVLMGIVSSFKTIWDLYETRTQNRCIAL